MTEYTKRDCSSLQRHFSFSSSRRPKARHLSAFPKLCSCCSLGFQFRFCWLGEDTVLLAASQIAQAKRSVAAPRCWYHFLPTRSEQEWKRWFLCYTRNTHNVCVCVRARARVLDAANVDAFTVGQVRTGCSSPPPSFSKLIIDLS